MPEKEVETIVLLRELVLPTTLYGCSCQKTTVDGKKQGGYIALGDALILS